MRAFAYVQAPRDTRFAPDAIKVKTGQAVTWEDDLDVGTVIDVKVILDGGALEVEVELNDVGARLLDLHRSLSPPEEPAP